MAIDSHMHINSIFLDNFHKYIDDINNNSDIESVVNVGVNLLSSKESILIADDNLKFYSTVGIHPLYLENEDVDLLYKLADNKKAVAIGEIGLDTLHNNFEEQKDYLIKQLVIARDLHLPVIIHSNNQNKEIIRIFERYIKPKYGCVFHCFQPDIDDLYYLISNGYYISFAGRITYKTAKRSLEIIKAVPNDLFLVETDSPFISPEPFRNEVNKSSNIRCIIEKISEIKDISYEEVDKITSENAKRLFKKMN